LHLSGWPGARPRPSELAVWFGAQQPREARPNPADAFDHLMWPARVCPLLLNVAFFAKQRDCARLIDAKSAVTGYVGCQDRGQLAVTSGRHSTLTLVAWLAGDGPQHQDASCACAGTPGTAIVRARAVQGGTLGREGRQRIPKGTASQSLARMICA